MRLSCKKKLHRALRIVHDFRQLIDIPEKECGPLISRKSSGKADRQGLRIEQIARGANFRRFGTITESLAPNIFTGEFKKL